MASNQAGAVTIDAREALCDGICKVLAAVPRHQQDKPFKVLFIPTIECLRTMTKKADESGDSSQGDTKRLISLILARVADEIRVLAVTAKTCLKAASESSDIENAQGEEPFLSVLRQAWPSISHAAEKFNADEVGYSLLPVIGVLSSLCFLTTFRFIVSVTPNRTFRRLWGSF